MNLKQFDLYGWNALKGQKLLAQGNALGIKAVSKAPCKGKSFKKHIKKKRKFFAICLKVGP